LAPIASDRLREAEGSLMADDTLKDIRHPDARHKMRNRSGQAGGLISKVKIDKQFNWRKVEMQESPAYRVLTLSARRVMDRLEIEFARHGLNPMENGRLPCTYDDFVEYGIESKSIAPAIRELVALGFIQVTRRGSAGNAEHRQVTLFLLTYRHAGSDARIEDGWKRIKTIEEAEAVAKAARQRAGDLRAQAFGRLGGLASQAKKQKSTSIKPTPFSGENPPMTRFPTSTKPTEQANSPPPKTPPLSILSLGRGIPPTPGVDYALNRLIDNSTSHRIAPIDALTAIEGLILSNALTDGSARSDAVH
jgi:hypothetical protein